MGQGVDFLRGLDEMERQCSFFPLFFFYFWYD